MRALQPTGLQLSVSFITLVSAFIQLGVPKLLARQFSYSRLSGWRLAQGPIMLTTVTNKRLTAKGYVSFTDYFDKLKQNAKKKI